MPVRQVRPLLGLGRWVTDSKHRQAVAVGLLSRVLGLCIMALTLRPDLISTS